MVNDDMHFDVFCESITDHTTHYESVTKIIHDMYVSLSLSIYKYENYESVINIMEKNKTDVFWESMNNWRVKS